MIAHRIPVIRNCLAIIFVIRAKDVGGEKGFFFHVVDSPFNRLNYYAVCPNA